jgi:hypothetical protein
MFTTGRPNGALGRPVTRGQVWFLPWAWSEMQCSLTFWMRMRAFRRIHDFDHHFTFETPNFGVAGRRTVETVARGDQFLL